MRPCGLFNRAGCIYKSLHVLVNRLPLLQTGYYKKAAAWRVLF